VYTTIRLKVPRRSFRNLVRITGNRKLSARPSDWVPTNAFGSPEIRVDAGRRFTLPCKVSRRVTVIWLRHRRELERQRDLARDVWKWCLLPFVPGLLATMAVPLLHLPPENWMDGASIGVSVILLWAAMFYAVWRLNKRGANKLQRQIDELNSMNRESP